MIDILVGACLGAGLVAVCWAFQTYSTRVEYTIQQEKDYIDVQADVDKIVTKLERIIYRQLP
jgi:hypothetical protein